MKHAKSAKKRTGKILFKEQSYRIIGACFEEIILEIKAVKQSGDEHRTQVINYLKATGKQLGLLVNVGRYPQIEHERLINHPISRVSRIS